MDITLPLVLKAVGGIIAGGAHRTIARAAREESVGWWITAMFVPGGSLFYGLRGGKEFRAVVIAMLVGSVIVGGGFGLGIYQRVQEVRSMAAGMNEAGADDDDDDDDGKKPVFYATEIPPTPVPAGDPGAARHALPSAAQVPARLQPKLKKLMDRYQELSVARAKLNPGDEDAVRAFNLRAEDYQAACRQFRLELAD